MRQMILAIIATVMVLALTPQARAGCSVLSMEGQVLTVDEPEAGAWERAHLAVTDVFKKSKVAGQLFEQVYMGGYKVQEVKADLATAEAEYNEALQLAMDTMGPFIGTCAGEMLEDGVRKAGTYWDPERNMVLGVLEGKPLKDSQKKLHDGREEDYLQFERRILRLVEGAQVNAGAAAPPAADPVEDTPAG